jgi:hypothetical protein
MELKVEITNFNKWEWEVPLPEVPEPDCHYYQCIDWQEELESGLISAFTNATQDHDLVINAMKHTLDNGVDEKTYQKAFKDVLNRWYSDERMNLYKSALSDRKDELYEALEKMRNEVSDNIIEWYMPTDLTHDYEENEIEYA